MPDPVKGGSLPFNFRHVSEVIAESAHGTAVKTGPKGRLIDGHAVRQGELFIIVGRARHHVGVDLDEPHSDSPFLS